MNSDGVAFKYLKPMGINLSCLLSDPNSFIFVTKINDVTTNSRVSKGSF